MEFFLGLAALPYLGRLEARSIHFSFISDSAYKDLVTIFRAAKKMAKTEGGGGAGDLDTALLVDHFIMGRVLLFNIAF